MRADPVLSHPDLPDYVIHELQPLLDSSNMSPADWQRIGQDICDHYEEYDGFIVLHGTDTMAYSASALSFLFDGLGKPVVFTGSQIPLCELRNDARENLVTSLLIAGQRENPRGLPPGGRPAAARQPLHQMERRQLPGLPVAQPPAAGKSRGRARRSTATWSSRCRQAPLRVPMPRPPAGRRPAPLPRHHPRAAALLPQAAARRGDPPHLRSRQRPHPPRLPRRPARSHRTGRGDRQLHPVPRRQRCDMDDYETGRRLREDRPRSAATT